MREPEELRAINDRTKQPLGQGDDVRTQGGTGADIESAIGACPRFYIETGHLDEESKFFPDLEAFLRFCETELGWGIDFDKPAGVILCHEQNKTCLCPMVRANRPDIPDTICSCTQGEIKRMFEYAIHRDVAVEIVHSFIRDGKSCVYKVTLL